MMRILVQLDGLLMRFGRVVPDSIAMIEDISVIDSRLRAARSEASIDLRLFRLPGDRNPADFNQPGNARSISEARVLKQYFDLPNAVLETSDGLQFLASGLDRCVDVVLTANFSVYRHCRHRDIWVVRIGDNGSKDECFVSYADVKRALEERLRIPTARPKSASVRTGGLLAIKCKDPDAAWERALRLIRKDRNADWIVLDDVLIFYTEEPDLEDGLVSESGVERLSLAVNKGALIVQQNGQGPEAGLLFNSSRFNVRQIDTEDVDESRRPDRGLRWEQVRRRRLVSSAAACVDLREVVDTGVPSLAIPQADSVYASKILAADARALPHVVRDIISVQLNQNISMDCYYEFDDPAAITWMTHSGSSSQDGIVAMIYRISIESKVELAAVNAILGIYAISRWLESIDHRLAAFHCLVLGADLSIENILSKALFDDEVIRLSHFVEFDNLMNSEKSLEIVTVNADSVDRHATKISGGDWCQSPESTDSVRKLQDTLLTLLT